MRDLYESAKDIFDKFPHCKKLNKTEQGFVLKAMRQYALIAFKASGKKEEEFYKWEQERKLTEYPPNNNMLLDVTS